MSRRRIIVLTGLPLLGWCAAAPAQNITVQQPAFGVNSVATTVSIPDRGGVILGGVSRGAASRSQYGPLRSGYGVGTAYEASATSAHVFIHDLREMDAAALAAAPRIDRRTVLEPGAEHAYRSLFSRHAGAAARGPAGRASLAWGTDRVDAERAARSYRLGLEAEARGAAGVARLHFESAARAGSAAAESRLAELRSSGASARPIASRADAPR